MRVKVYKRDGFWFVAERVKINNIPWLVDLAWFKTWKEAIASVAVR